MSRFRFVAVVLAAMAVWTIASVPAPACPFCSMQGQTLTMEINQSAMVIYGTLANARLDPASEFGAGTTDLQIEEVIKPHDFLKGKKVIVLPKYIPVDNNNKAKFLVFCDYYKEKVDPYRGVPVKDKAIVEYLKGALANKDKDIGARLAFFFGHLGSEDSEVSTDAYKEFANAENKVVLQMIEKMDRPKVAAQLTKWLTDAQTPSYRYGLYGYLLGLCGTANDGVVLKELLEDPNRGLVSGIDGVLAGYITLQPKEGWAYLLNILKDSSKEFTRRYAALRTLRHFWEHPTGAIKQTDVLAGMTILLGQNDIADLAIEDLRKWQQWQLADEVLALAGKPGFDVPIIQRAVIRYALGCQKTVKKAGEFVQEQIRRDPEKVKEIEELLKFELPPAASPPTAASK